MARRHEAAELVKQGRSPAEVAATMGVSGYTVRLYLLEQVAEGGLLRMDVLRSIDDSTRQAYEAYIEACGASDYWTLVSGGRREGFDDSQFQLYLDFRNAVRGELYMSIANLEMFLHDKIQSTLIREYGPKETEWWREGIPEQIRISCVTTREADPYPPGEPYGYTTFIHLSKIIEKNWRLFAPLLPRELSSDKKSLASTLNRLNGIRNAVMHPVKQCRFSDDDFLFVQEVSQILGNRDRWGD